MSCRVCGGGRCVAAHLLLLLSLLATVCPSVVGKRAEPAAEPRRVASVAQVPNLDKQMPRQPGDHYHRAQIKDQDYLLMYQSWMDTGLSSALSAIAQQRLKRQRRSVADRFGECSAQATELTKHAKCVSKLLRNEFKSDSPPKRKDPRRRLLKYQPDAGEAEPVAKAQQKWTGGFRRSRRSPRIQQAEEYSLKTGPGPSSPFGLIARLLSDSIKAAKNKTELPHWQQTVQELKQNGQTRKKLQKRIEEDSEESMGQLALRGARAKMEAQEKLPAGLDLDKVEELAKDPKQLDKLMKAMKKRKMKPEERVVDLIRQAMKLGYELAGQNTTDFEHKSLKLASPRFLGVTKENKADDEGEGLENLTSLPSLLNGFGLEDQQLWLDVIMEAAGVNEQNEKLVEEIKTYESKPARPLMPNVSELVGEDGRPMYATRDNITELGGSLKPVELFEKLHMTYSKKQLRDMNTTGIATLRPDQLQLLYGPRSPYKNKAALKKLSNLSESELHAHIEDDIHRLAEMESFKLRHKDIVLSPVSFVPAILAPALVSQPFVLSPIIFTPLVLSPSVFGAIILSPWMFVPLVLSPRVLGTLVLAPFIFSPLILTPLALHPAILSPGIFNPLVLSPFVLTPFILSPQVFTPLILSPFCLSPLILNPMVGSPLVLSPFVLSPVIASPMALSALVMSPYALSPVIFSPLIVFAAILSPSFLS